MNKILALVVTVVFLIAGISLSAIMEMLSLTSKYVIVGFLVAVFYIVVLQTLDEYKTTREKDGIHN